MLVRAGQPRGCECPRPRRPEARFQAARLPGNETLPVRKRAGKRGTKKDEKVFCGSLISVKWKNSQLIINHGAEFYKPFVPQYPPSYFQNYSICNIAMLKFPTVFNPGFVPNEWFTNNGLLSRGSNPRPVSHEPS